METPATNPDGGGLRHTSLVRTEALRHLEATERESLRSGGVDYKHPRSARLILSSGYLQLTSHNLI